MKLAAAQMSGKEIEQIQQDGIASGTAGVLYRRGKAVEANCGAREIHTGVCALVPVAELRIAVCGSSSFFLERRAIFSLSLWIAKLSLRVEVRRPPIFQCALGGWTESSRREVVGRTSRYVQARLDRGVYGPPTPDPAAAVNAARFIATFVDMNWVLMTPCHPFLLVCVTILVNFIVVKK